MDMTRLEAARRAVTDGFCQPDVESEMAKEIEHKFLVVGDGWRAEVRDTARLRQGYLFADERVAIRVRTAGETGYLTIKADHSAVVRDEFEYEIPLADAEAMLALCRGGAGGQDPPHAGPSGRPLDGRRLRRRQ